MTITAEGAMMETTSSTVHEPRRAPGMPTYPVSLEAAAEELLEHARGLHAARAARTLTPGAGAALTQTLVALCAGTRLHEHTSPGPASIHVLQGTVVLGVEGDRQTLITGDWSPIPPVRHDLEAVSDATVLITVAPRPTRPPADTEGPGAAS